jgi:hypothetical protein
MNKGLLGITPRPGWSDVQHPAGNLGANGYMWTPIIPNANGSGALTLNVEYLIYFDLWVPHRIFALAAAQTSAGSAGARVSFGLRGMMMDGWPGPLLSEGSYDATSTGSKYVRQDIDLQPGRYCACYMGTGWVTTAPQFRGNNAGNNDFQSYGYDLPRLGIVPQAVSVALPSAGNVALSTASRTTDGRLTLGAVRDWVNGTNTAALYVVAEPLL